MDGGSFQLEQLREAARKGELLKDSPLRRVWRARIGDSSVVLKEARIRGLAERVRSIWLRSRVRVEAANLREAERRALPCPRALGHLVAAGLAPRSGWLVLQDLGAGVSVDAALLQCSPRERVALLARCGEVLKRAHSFGLRHRDLHLGNLWRRADGALFLLDLHAAHFVAPKGAAAFTAKSLDGLQLSLPWPGQRAEREALFSALVAADPSLRERLEARLPRVLCRHLVRRRKRALRASGSYRSLPDPSPAAWGMQARGSDALESSEALKRAIAAGVVLKSGRRGRVVRSAWRRKSVIAKLRNEAASLSAWRAASALCERKLPHARVLATFTATPESLDRPARWILSEDVVGTDLAADERATCAGFARLLALRFGRYLGRLHASGMRCRDSRLDNFVVRDRALVLVDLDGVAPIRPWQSARGVAAADLGRALAWLRFQAPAWLRARSDEIAGLAFAAWRRESSALRAVLGAEEEDRFARRIELRCRRWARRHRVPKGTLPDGRNPAGATARQAANTSDRDALGSASDAGP